MPTKVDINKTLLKQNMKLRQEAISYRRTIELLKGVIKELRGESSIKNKKRYE